MINWQAVLFPDQICVSNDAAEKPDLKHSLFYNHVCITKNTMAESDHSYPLLCSYVLFIFTPSLPCMESLILFLLFHIVIISNVRLGFNKPVIASHTK